MDLEDVLRPSEHPETLEHVLAARRDPGDHLDVASLLPRTLLDHPETLDMMVTM